MSGKDIARGSGEAWGAIREVGTKWRAGVGLKPDEGHQEVGKGLAR